MRFLGSGFDGDGEKKIFSAIANFSAGPFDRESPDR